MRLICPDSRNPFPDGDKMISAEGGPVVHIDYRRCPVYEQMELVGAGNDMLNTVRFGQHVAFHEVNVISATSDGPDHFRALLDIHVN